MQVGLEETISSARKLPRSEKAKLVRILIADLDEGEDEDVEALWAAEAESRLDAYLKGELEAIDGDEAMTKLRNTLK